MPVLTIIPDKFSVIKKNLTASELYTLYNPDYIINGGLYDSDTGRNMTYLTYDGVNAGNYFSKQGIGFNVGQLEWCKQGEAYNFIGGSPVIVIAGEKVLDWGNTVSDYLKQKHIRSYAGITKNNELVIGVTEKAVDLNELQDIAIKAGCYYAINLDGGGSCHLQQGEKVLVNSGRKNASWILVWGDTVKTNIGLVEHAKMALTEAWGYVFGTYGQVLTDSLLKFKAVQYPQMLTDDKLAYIRSHYMGKRVADCGGLIKSYLWWNGGDPIYMATNDASVDAMYQQAKEKGQINVLPEIAGLIVWHEGHAGIYTGKGVVIESRGTLHGVVTTMLNNRPFTHWFKHKDITYLPEDVSNNEGYLDVEPDRWSYHDIMRITELGLMGGYPDGTFKPTEPVTREQMAALMNRTINYIGG